MDFSFKLLDKNNIENIHEQTLYLLEKHGIIFEDDEILELFKKNGAKTDGYKVRIPAPLIEKILKAAPSEFTLSARNPDNDITIGKRHNSTIGPAAGFINVSSLEHGVKTATIEDFKNFISLTQTSPANINQVGILYPKHTSSTAELCNMQYEAVKLCDKPIFGLIQNYEVAAHSVKMANLAVNRECDNYVLGTANGISPLKWDSSMLGGIKAFAQKKQPLSVSVCSMAGFTSPVNLTQTILQNNAEIIAGICAIQLINPGNAVVYGNTSTSADFKSMNLAIGSPASQLISMGSSQLARFYKIPFRGGGALTDSKEIDAQTGMESSLNLALSILPEYDLIMQGLGVTESFMTLSYEKWILDEEIINRLLYLKNYQIKNLNNNDSDMISSIGEGESFMMLPETMLNFKDEIFHETISDRTTRSTWKTLNQNLMQKAEKVWKKRLEEFIPPEIDHSVLLSLQNYIEKL